MSIDARFFKAMAPQSAEQIATMTKGQLQSLAHAEKSQQLFTSVSALKDAQSTDISVFYDQRYKAVAAQTKAGLVLTSEALAGLLPAQTQVIFVADPQLAFAKLCAQFFSEAHPQSGISAQAYIAASAQIADNVSIGAGAFIGEQVQIGEGTQILPGAYIGDGVVIGKNCSIGAHASIRYSLIGNKVRILSGARLGERGFGYVKDSFGAMEVPQLGRVIVEDNVEIGANGTIDRGTVQDTKIGYGCMIDNMVMIGHNCQIGRFVAIIGKASIGGSARVEDFAYIGGEAAISGHKTIGAGARINACSFIISDVPAKAVMNGYPAGEGRTPFKMIALLRNMLKKEAKLR